MPSLGPAEILVILVIALLVFGPNKMPDIARQVGRGMRELKRVQQHLSTELRDVVADFDGSATDPPAAPTGDAVPVLPPKVDVEPRPSVSTAPSTPAPTAELAPVETGGDEPVADGAPAAPSTTHRGQRVWPPPASPPA
jgi:sec-independent protein translocase protein TatA